MNTNYYLVERNSRFPAGFKAKRARAWILKQVSPNGWIVIWRKVAGVWSLGNGGTTPSIDSLKRTLGKSYDFKPITEDDILIEIL